MATLTPSGSTPWAKTESWGGLGLDIGVQGYSVLPFLRQRLLERPTSHAAYAVAYPLLHGQEFLDVPDPEIAGQEFLNFPDPEIDGQDPSFSAPEFRNASAMLL